MTQLHGGWKTLRPARGLRKHFLALLLAVTLGSRAQAQADSAAVIFGTVYDSVAARPLGGAVVQLVASSAAAPFTATALADANGHYEIRGVPPGSYVVGFQHPALDSLSITSPLRAVTVRVNERSKVDLAVPSSASIVRAVCGETGADSIGLVIGVLRNARTGLSIDSGMVTATWEEFVIAAGAIRRTHMAAQSALNAAGFFTLCRVPSGVELSLSAISGGDSTGTLLVSVTPRGLARRDLMLGGTAVVTGTLLSDAGRPIANGRIEIAGRENDAVTDSAGHFRLASVRAGTQTIEARALGFAPAYVALQLRADQDTTVLVTLTSVRHLLDTMRVVAQRVYNRDSNGFEQRRRSARGFFMTASDIGRRRPYDVYSLLMEAPQIRMSSSVPGRNGMGSAFDRTFLMRASLAGDMCVPELWIDGIKMPADLVGQIDFLVRPEEIAGIEVYPSGSAPAQFTSALWTGCGSIVIWTQPVVRPPKKKP